MITIRSRELTNNIRPSQLPTAMDYSTIEKLETWLRDAQSYTEENILRLPHRRTVRLLLIIGAYYLLRPWLLKLAGLSSEFNFGKGSKNEEGSPAATEALNALDGATDVSQDVDSEDGGNGDDSMRRRQKPLEEILEGRDRAPADAEADSDREIEGFLRKAIQ